MTTLTFKKAALVDVEETEDEIELDGVLTENVLAQLIENFEDDVNAWEPLIHALKLALLVYGKAAEYDDDAIERASLGRCLYSPLLLARIVLDGGRFDESKASSILLHMAILAHALLSEAEWCGVELPPSTRAGFEQIKSVRSDLWELVEETVSNQGGR
jgi:hypothetical protein